MVHSNFARSQISKLRAHQASLDPDLASLLNFVGGYIVTHEVYAHTAWDADATDNWGGPVTDMCDDSNLQTLTGCSTAFFQILADVNTLAGDYARSKSDYADPAKLADLDLRRHNLERQLHSYAPSAKPEDHEQQEETDFVSESALTLDIRRLTGLLHLYSRIDHLGPDDPCVSSLATQILHLISKAPTRSNIILWPLFMTATLGIGPHCEEDRVFVLQKINALQEQRQMRYIKKARRIIKGVWKLRDARDAEMRMGWGILQHVAQKERISLL